MHILVVDDDPGLRDLLEFALSIEGHEVRSAKHGGEAIQMLSADYHPDIILLDMQMPVKTGAEVLDALRSMPNRPRVIVLSDRLPPEACLFPGDDFIAKPYNVHAVIDAIAATPAQAA